MQPRVLVVDDDPSVLRAHARYVESLGYEADTAADGFEAIAKLSLGFDLVLLDIDMAGLDGFDVARQIRDTRGQELLPIIMVTGLDGPTYFRRALESGANDLITKPIDPDELRLRSKWLLQLKVAHDSLGADYSELRSTAALAAEDLRAALKETSDAQRRTHIAHLDTIRRLSIAGEYRDELTAGHIERMGLYAAIVAQKLGLTPTEVRNIRHATPLHDVGKIGIPERILLKPGPLDEGEMEIMRRHTTLGAEMLDGSDAPVIQMGARIAMYHHERWDGSGYPVGLSGVDIPVEARLCHVVDSFDAATMDRPYRVAVARDEVIEHMKQSSGAKFDPSVLVAFLACLPDLEKVRAEHPVP